MTMIKFQRMLMAAFIILIPVIYPIADVSNIRQFQQLVFQYGAMIICSFFVGNVWAGILMAWSLFLFYLNGGNVGHETVFNIFLGIMLFGISRRFFKTFRFEKEAKWIGVVGLVSVGFMVLQFFGVDPLNMVYNPQVGTVPEEALKDMVGTFALKAHNGIYLALVSCYLTYLFAPLAIIGIALVGISLSSAAVLASMCGVLFYCFHHARRWFWILLTLSILGGAAYTVKDIMFDKKMYCSRLNMWHLVVKKCIQRPMGYGPDSFREYTPSKSFMIMGDEERRTAIMNKIPGTDQSQFIYYDPNPRKMFNDYKDIVPKSPNMWDHPHNEYLNIWFWFGFPGLVILFFMLKDLVITFRKADKTKEVVLITSMLIVYAVASLTQFPLCVSRLGYLFPILLGAFYASTSSRD